MSPKRTRWVSQAVAAGITLAAALGVVLLRESREPATPAPSLTRTVRMQGFAFTGDVYRIPAATPVRLMIRNADRAAHTFTVPELDVDRLVGPGGRAVVDLRAPAGTYTIYCRPHADVHEPDPAKAGMAARLVVGQHGE